MEHLRQLYETWPEVLGGFIGYLLHDLKHKGYALLKALPARVRKP